MEEPIEKEEQIDESVDSKKEAKIAKKKSRIGLIILHIVAVIILIGGTAATVYWWRDRVAADAAAKLSNQIESLQKSVTALKSQITIPSTSSATVTTNTVGTTTNTAVAISETAKTNIILAVSTGNTQPLEGYMADSVNVILAATEAYGAQTATQAAADVTTFIGNSMETTWNFNLSAATIASTYGTSGYSQYFPTGALVGKSGNNKVISFQFNSNAKISTIFMASASELVSN